MKINVKAAEGLSFKVMGQRIDDKKYYDVSLDHNVQQKINDGSLIVEKPFVKIDKSKKSEVR